MKSISIHFRNVCRAVSLALALCLANVVSGAPLIQSIQVSPNPLITGQNFTIAVAASADVTQAVARVDFRPGTPLLVVPLIQQGTNWTGSGVVPPDSRLAIPAGAPVRVMVFKATRQRNEGVLHAGVQTNSITAILANGILTVTGDDHDNAITVTRNAPGTI